MGCFKAASVRPYSMLFKSSFTKEVSPWLSLSVKCPRLVAISVVAPTGSSLLPALRFAPSAVNPSCPTELARLAAPTMAVRSWPLRRSKAKAENAEEGFVPSSFSFFNDARSCYRYVGSLTRPVTHRVKTVKFLAALQTDTLVPQPARGGNAAGLCRTGLVPIRQFPNPPGNAQGGNRKILAALQTNQA